MVSAENQQERLDPNWIVGFTDGEGCFTISLMKIKNRKRQHQIFPEFRVVQHQRDEQLLKELRD